MILKPQEHKEYLKWKKKTVSFRGTNDKTKPNEMAGSVLGEGLYTAALSNKSMAKQYGELYYVVNAVPKKPLVFNNLNNWEIWMQNKLLKPYGYDKSEFQKVTSIEKEIMKMGYDGVILTGREMVNYTPPESVRYFRYENGEYSVIDYYINFVKAKNSTT